jgi:SpoIIAA-like
VTDVDWVARMVRAFGFVLPGDVRIFDNQDLDDAREWICSPPSPGKLEFELLTGQSVLVLRPQGELEAGDFKRVATEVDPYIDRVGGLSGVVIVADEFPGWDDYAAFSAHLNFVREHQSKTRRVAIVTSSHFLSAVPRMANLFLNAEVRKFDSGETEAAIAWAAKG